jgi:hypothetical protein
MIVGSSPAMVRDYRASYIAVVLLFETLEDLVLLVCSLGKIMTCISLSLKKYLINRITRIYIYIIRYFLSRQSLAAKQG